MPKATAWWVGFFEERRICVTVRNEAVTTYPDTGVVVDEITRSSVSGAQFRLVARQGPDRCVPDEVAGP